MPNDGPKPNDRAKPELLTDQQAADRTGWSRLKVQRLRLAGKLPYFPGRPALIDAADLADVEPAEARRREQLQLERERENAARAAQYAEEELNRRVRISWLRRRIREEREIEEHNKRVRATAAAAADNDQE
jgi:hypothetical protein